MTMWLQESGGGMTFGVAVDAALARITMEIGYGRKKHGRMKSPHDGFSRLRGEVLELEAEVHAEDRIKRRAEALQVAAMAVRLAVEEWSDPSTKSDSTSSASTSTPATSTKKEQPS